MERFLSTELKEAFHALAKRVRFNHDGVASIIDGIAPPDGTELWSNPFALIALIPAPALSNPEFHTAVENGRNWMLRRLHIEERKGRFIDGYLVYAVPDSPEESMRRIAQLVELDTRVCRKHVLWPTVDGEWQDRLWTVIPLGFPCSDRTEVQVTPTPKLPEIAEQALNYYSEHGRYDSVAELLLTDIRQNIVLEEVHAHR